MSKELSPAQCVLLTVHYASEGNIEALHSFTPTRLDALDPELVLRILLAYLPESIEPREYTTYVGEVASRLYLDVDREDVVVDTSPVKDLDEEVAKRKVRKLTLPELRPPAYPPGAPDNALICFLCHRAYRIDAETGLLNLTPQLIEPFLERHDYLRTWYISVVLPIHRLQLVYYPGDEGVAIALSDFEKLSGREAIDFLMRRSAMIESNSDNGPTDTSPKSEVVRDIKGLVGPWMYGDTQRKRRKLDNSGAREEASGGLSKLSNGMRKISLTAMTPEDATGHDWEQLYPWMVFQARDNFPLVAQIVEEWDGPGDVDLGGLNPGNADTYLDEDLQTKLEKHYAQAAFAACYAVQADDEQTVRGAHTILARLAELLDFIPPPDLATSVESLPKVTRQSTALDGSEPLVDSEPDTLLKPGHTLTAPELDRYMLLQMVVYSAYQLAGLGYPISLVNVAKLHSSVSADEPLSVLQKILHGLLKRQANKDEVAWASDRSKLIWLWNWGIDTDDENATKGAGVLGKIPRDKFEEEMLKCFTEASSYELAINLYLSPPPSHLRHKRAEQIILMRAMEAYDDASNGNRNRGGMKKANDIISTFRPYFSESVRFRQASALISATHALSFYSLTLQHGVPFQPVSIRVSQDPIGLISKVLEQNPRSYTKLDDLIDIGRHLVSAGLPQSDNSGAVAGEGIGEDPEELESRREDAGRRVTFMAMESALQEGDFETAYSYIVSRLTPQSTNIEAPETTRLKPEHTRNVSKNSTPSKVAASDDDVSWRAAFLAGRYRPAAASPPTLRRLEQRTELLSLALLLAPVSALTEILAAWRRCEEEMSSLQVAQQQAEEEFDDRADKRQSTSSLPGNFTVHGDQPQMVLNQKRREMGRMSGKAGESEAPVSMFDLTRSAAQALSKNAFPLRGAARSSSSHESGSMETSVESLGGESGTEGQQRVRRRDMVANAVSGGLASGLGWVLGATPAGGQQQQQQ
ncbi:hypothetical protein LTR37_000219 [Vermiconidia calcicola]|uniref:Uncharacterized protein n=1 Tax=Vermiconidia calcicola TaxID=1690605 RepID=A0ACC3NZV9_9PEZI|nr:hypothetical protein LTR37_000219 [Vermiconidia calcicola]